MPTTRLKEKLSTLVSTQLPEHIVSEYPTFVKFLEYYYQFIEQDQSAQELLQNARSYADVDKTIDSFLDYFINQYALGIPKTILADKALFIKYAKDLHKHKGTEEAFRILFRILFNEEIDFFYPNQVILKPSDGVWTRNYLLRASAISGSPFDLAGTKITGNTSGATATVESVLSFLSGTTTVYEIYLNSDTISGTFQAGENIRGFKLNNTITGANSIITANLYPIVTKIDVVDGGLGYILDQSITISGPNGSGASGIVSSISDAGAIREITLSNFGFGYDIKPNVSIGSPIANITGTYRITSNIGTFRLSNNHSLVVGDNVSISFSGNTSSDLNGSSNTFTVTSIPNLKTFEVANVSRYRTGLITASNANTGGNVSVQYTINKFINGRYTLSSNTVTVTTPIEHGLAPGDSINVIFNKTDVDSFTGSFVLKNYSNVTVGFTEPHGFSVNSKINATFDSNYTNSTVGTYTIKAYGDGTANIANIYFDSAHSFINGQNINVRFGATLSNVLVGTFQTVGNVGIAFLNVDSPYQINDIINVTFTSAVYIEDTDKPQLAGNANITLNSNALVGNNTYFQSNIFAGNVITVNLQNTFTVANVVSNTLAYLTTNATTSLSYANVYLATSNLNGNSTITAVRRFLDLNPNPNNRRIFFDLVDKPKTKGTITISNGYTNALVNSFVTTTVTNNGYPLFNYLSFALPVSFANANVRGNVTVSNQDRSNIVGNIAKQVTVVAVPTVRSLIFVSNTSSNAIASNGNITVNTDLPNDIEDFANTYTVASVAHTRAFAFASSNANSRGNITVYYQQAANLQANIGALAIEPGVWVDDRGKLDETFRVQGRIGTDARVFYQPFSYVIKSSQPLSAWREAVKKLLHPAGFEVFGEVVISTNQNNVQNVTAEAKFFPIKVLGPITVDSTSILADATDITADLDTVS